MFEKKRRCVWKKRRAIGECVRRRACSHLGAFALHLYRFSHGQSYFSFSKKIYWSRMGFRMGSKIGSRFEVQKGVNYFVNTRKIHVTCTRMFQLSLSICLSVCLSILSFTEIQIVCTSINDFVQQLLCFVFIPAYIRIK